MKVALGLNEVMVKSLGIKKTEEDEKPKVVNP